MLVRDPILQHVGLPEATLGTDGYLSFLTIIVDVDLSNDLDVTPGPVLGASQKAAWRRAESEEMELAVAAKHGVEAAGGLPHRVTRHRLNMSEAEHLLDGIPAWHSCSEVVGRIDRELANGYVHDARHH